MKTLTIFSAMLISFAVSAQDYKPLKVNISAGKAQISGKSEGGFLVSVEPRYGKSNYFDLGLRLEAAGAQRLLQINGQQQKSEAKFFGSGLLTGNFYLTGAGLRPYIGAGVGLYQFGRVTFGDIPESERVDFDPSTRFGGMIRAGLKLGHINAAVEYNMVSASKYTINGDPLKATNNYVGFKIGLDLGGGKK
ncbi:hypothetical protein [Larkinella terrae]|uniref:Outer membrane beta-barrel protein n=1 Tax=Larkinella terrae TaxID=2025311 RepID=A0A7K0EPW3_9BACT|nr:hypothetical protein [Larkinella terrae]MRS63870.1 hypothetical protein [Larkinella terrae]